MSESTQTWKNTGTFPLFRLYAAAETYERRPSSTWMLNDAVSKGERTGVCSVRIEAIRRFSAVLDLIAAVRKPGCSHGLFQQGGTITSPRTKHRTIQFFDALNAHQPHSSFDLGLQNGHSSLHSRFAGGGEGIEV